MSTPTPSPTCCGKPRTTRFCPECGKKLRADPDNDLFALLAHCRSTAATQRGKAKAYERRREAGKLRDWEEVHVEASRVAAVKWDRWADELAALLAEGNSSGPGGGEAGR